jgi:outer membrane protein TolC
MNRKPFIVIIITSLVFLAAVSQMFAQDASEVLKLTLADAINRAIEHSPEVKKAQLDLRLAEINYMEIESAGVENLSPLQLENAQLNLERAKEAVINVMKNVALNMEDSYYQLIKARAQLEAAKRSVESKERQYNIVKVQYEAGRESQKNFDQAKRGWDDALQTLENQTFSLETQMMEFCLALGVKYGTEIELVDRFPYEPLDIDLTEAINYALENRSDIKTRRKAVEDALEKVVLADNPWTPAIELERAKIALSKAEIDLTTTEANIAIIVRKAYASFLSVDRNVLLRQSNLDSAILELEKIKIQYEKGFATYNNVWDAEARVEDATQQLLDAVFNYNKGKASFYQAIGKEYIEIDLLSEEVLLYE